MKLPDKHINFTSESDVKEIVKPFFEISGINYFFYTEIFKAGYCFCLSSNAEWQRFFFEKKLYTLNTEFPANGYHLCITKNPVIAANAKTHFNIDNYLIFTREYKDYYMMAGFGTTHGNEKVLDYYISNRETLDRFILYFKHQANGLIKLSKKQENIIVLPEFSANNFALQKAGNSNLDFLESHSPVALLSKREIDCVKYFLAGATIRDTADKLFLSPRTVETHLENVKNKLGCNKKSEVITILLKNGFIPRTE